MKLIGFLLVLFVGMSSVTYGQQDIYKQVERFYNAVDKSNSKQIIELGNSIFDYIEYNKIPTDTSVVDLLFNVGYHLKKNGDFTAALKVYQSIQDRINYEWGPDYINYHITILNMARLHNQLGDFNNAVLLQNQLLEIFKKKYGDKSIEVAVVYLDLHNTYKSLGDFEKAIDYNLRSQRIHRKKGKEGLKGLAQCLNDISITYQHINKYDKALKSIKESLHIRGELFGEVSDEYGQGLNNLSNFYSRTNNIDKALHYGIKSRDINRKLHGAENQTYALVTANLAYSYHLKGDFDQALKLYFESKLIYENSKEINFDWYASLLNNMALTYSLIRKFELSLIYQKKAIKINQKLFGKLHFEVSRSISNLGGIFQEMLLIDSALVYHNKALIIDEKLNLDSSMTYVRDLNYLGRDYELKGEFSKAIDKYEQALTLSKYLTGENTKSYFALTMKLANLYRRIGNQKLAFELVQEYTDIDRYSFGSEWEYAMNNIILSKIHLANEKYELSLKFADRALQLMKKKYGRKNPNYIGCLNHKLYVLAEFTSPEERIKLSKKNYKLARKYCDSNDFILSVARSNLALLNYELGNYQDAVKLETDNIEHLKIDSSSNLFIGYLEMLSTFTFASGQPVMAQKYFFDAINLRLTQFNKNRFGLSHKDIRNIKNEICNNLFKHIDLFMINVNGFDRFFQIWIDINAILNSDIASINNLKLHHSYDATLVKLFDSYKSGKTYLNSIYERPNEQFENKQELVDSLTKKSETLEKLLSRKSQLFTDAYRDISITDLANHLNQREFYIDIIKIDEFNLYTDSWLDSTQYLVFIVDSKDTLVDYVLIKDGSFLDQDVYDAYKHGVTQAKSELKNANFYNRLWKPIADKIGDAKKVYISLGGVYNKINLNTIYNPNTGKYLMEELDIQIVNSARDFVLMKEKKQKKYKSNVAALFGYPDFDSNQKEEQTEEEFAYSRDLAAFWIDSLNRGGHRASPLPGTKTEIETIEAAMSKNNWEVRSFMQEQASESNFKKQHSPRVLHVATHGYFFEDIPMENDQMRFMGMDRERVVQDPMLRSGLLLAGANKALAGAESEGENGLLSASEASLLDLSETELVVMSACETGRGEIKNSEGVYGLRKAFTNAGAENTIMSLWKVDDKVTQEFMTTFYTYWLEDKMSIREAFKSTRSTIKSKYPQPYYWGAFILVGR